MPTRFGHAQCLPNLIILDDLLNEAYSREVCNLFTKGSHNRNLNGILITQNLSSRQTLEGHHSMPNIWFY
jgi:hypothetical protein